MEIKTVIGRSFGTNCYVIQEGNSAFIIDIVPEIKSFLDGSNLENITVCLTHVHYDHFQTLGTLQKEFPIHLIMSEPASRQVNDPMYNLSAFGMPAPETIDLEEVQIVGDGEVITWNAHEVKILATPGHSEDSVSYVLDEIQTIFTGDTVFNHGIGRYDLPSSNRDDLIRSIQKILHYSTENYRLYPGHGPETSIENELEFNRNFSGL